MTDPKNAEPEKIKVSEKSALKSTETSADKSKAPGNEPEKTVDEPVATVEAPYPTQADLDAIKAGTYGKTRELKPVDDNTGYQTR